MQLTWHTKLVEADAMTVKNLNSFFFVVKQWLKKKKSLEIKSQLKHKS